MEDGFPTTTLGNDKGNVNDKKNRHNKNSAIVLPAGFFRHGRTRMTNKYKQK